MIISASRRTDIPAFYSTWFMNRLRAGFLLVRNPFNFNQVRRVSLQREDVDAIVFWTRNPRALMPFLPELDSLGHNYYFQYTITGYPRSIEKSVPHPYRSIEDFKALSSQLGSRRVIWRYDPIILANALPVEEHKRLFEKISNALAGSARRVVISFADFYQKTERNLAAVEGLIHSDIVQQQDVLDDLTNHMVKVSKANDMEISTCAETVEVEGMPHGKCIDDRLLSELFGITLDGKKDKGQRDACGCVKSIDIGMYNTCLHGCSYCYATFSHGRVLANKKNHDPNSPFLVGGMEGADLTLIEEEKSQGSLF